MSACLEIPKPGRGHAVLVLHSWWGLTPFFVDVCRRFSAESFVSLYAARSGDYSKSSARFLGHFAESDPWVSAAAVRRLGRSLDKAGREFIFHIYPGTSHWFFERNHEDAFHPKAAESAWERTLAFIRQTLGTRRAVK